MIKIENVVLPSSEQWKAIIMGTRNPMNSWSRSDTEYNVDSIDDSVWPHKSIHDDVVLGPNDHDLMMRLVKGGSVHAKYRRMITVYMDITAPFYWWKEFSTYKVGTVANSCSTMHKIAAKEFTLEDFSCEHLIGAKKEWIDKEEMYSDENFDELWSSYDALDQVVRILNFYREKYLETKDKRYWWQMIQLLPTSYNQRRTVMLNYEVLAGIYPMRRNHKLDEWREFCGWIKTLPYSEIITADEGPFDN